MEPNKGKTLEGKALEDRVLTCYGCGSTHFVQKAVLKTGVRVVNGQVLYLDEFPTPLVVGLFCRKCGTVMIPKSIKNFKPLKPAPLPSLVN